jgi:hypothetical protein
MNKTLKEKIENRLDWGGKSVVAEGIKKLFEEEMAEKIREVEDKKKYVIANYDGDLQRGYVYGLKDTIEILKK